MPRCSSGAQHAATGQPARLNRAHHEGTDGHRHHGAASPAFRHEEDLLLAADDAETYNHEVIWMNREYVKNWSLGANLPCVRDSSFCC